MHARSLGMVMFPPSSSKCTHLPGVSLQIGINMRHHALLLILVQPSLHIKPPQSIHHICIWICRFENWHVQMHGSKAFLILPPPPVLHSLWSIHLNLPLFYQERMGVSFLDTPLPVGALETFLTGGLWAPLQPIHTPCLPLDPSLWWQGGTSHQWQVGF